MRMAHALLALVLLPFLQVGAASAGTDQLPDQLRAEQQQARQLRARVSLKTTTPWVRKGGTIALKGRVKGTRGRTRVTIFQRKIGQRGWGVEAVKRTTRKGRFSHREGLTKGSRHYKACAKGRCSRKILVRQGKPPTPPPPPPPVKQDTAVAVDALPVTSIDAGQTLNLSGSASGNINGGTVYVQAYDAGSSSWGSVGSAVVTAGRWSASVTISTAGRAIPLRAYFPGDPGLKESASASHNLTVFGWYFFYDEGPLDSVAGGWNSFNTTTINTNVFPRSVAMEPDSWSSDLAAAEFNLNRSCTTFQASAGLSDDTSDTARKFNMVIKGDSVTKYTKTGISYAAPVPIDIDISGILRLRVEADQTAGRSYGLLWLGDARVRCAF